jgi:hypothetical protein
MHSCQLSESGNRDTNLCARKSRKFGATTPTFGEPHPILPAHMYVAKSGQSVVKFWTLVGHKKKQDRGGTEVRKSGLSCQNQDSWQLCTCHVCKWNSVLVRAPAMFHISHITCSDRGADMSQNADSLAASQNAYM